MFALGLPVLEKIARPIIIYAVLILGLRLAGKRELAQLNPFDLVVLLTISNTVQNAIIGDDNSVTGGIIGVATLLILNYLVVRFIYQNNKLEKLVEGSEDVLISDGKIAEYLGDLLPGFYVEGAPDFERWLEAERTRLSRMLHHDVAGMLAAARMDLSRLISHAPADSDLPDQLRRRVHAERGALASGPARSTPVPGRLDASRDRRRRHPVVPRQG